MGRMSALHDGIALTQGQSVAPASRNGGASNAAVNGTAIDLRGKRGAYFIVEAGAITGSGNYAAYLQTSNLETDPTNGTWTNVNATTYTNAAVTVKTNANSAFEMSYDPAVGGVPNVRAVLVVDANIVLSGISHVVY
jgi:hypothetical protein